MGDLTLSGYVKPGEGIATDLGCPTANLEITGGAFIPSVGVYVGFSSFESQRLASLICINDGRTGEQLKVEVHILNQEIDLRGKFLEVELLEKRRGLVIWESDEQMRALIAKDMLEARKWFEDRGFS